MFEILPNPSLETLLIAGRALMLVGAFWIFALAFSRWRRADASSTAMLAAQLERTFAEVRSLHETVTVLGARLEAMSEKNDTESRRAPAGGAGSQRGYDVATRLARNGADADDLMANCGVTRHEAELLVRLHGAKSNRDAAVATPRTQRAVQEERPAARQAAPAHADAPPAQGRKRGSLLSVVG
jgi:hypothetical protein